MTADRYVDVHMRGTSQQRLIEINKCGVCSEILSKEVDLLNGGRKDFRTIEKDRDCRSTLVEGAVLRLSHSKPILTSVGS